MSHSRLYKIWVGIRSRCNNPNKREYPDYGGRGIKICAEWDGSFPAFRIWAEASGYNDDLTIDRIDNNGNYEPSNCRWVTIMTQANNKRGNHFLTFRGETKTISEFARQVGLKRVTVDGRLKANWTVERALTETPRNWGR